MGLNANTAASLRTGPQGSEKDGEKSIKECFSLVNSTCDPL